MQAESRLSQSTTDSTPEQTEHSDTSSLVAAVATSDIIHVWPEVTHLLDRAFAYSDGKFSKRYVFDQLLAGGMQLWVAPRCVLVTRILNYPEKRIMELFLCGGENLAEHLDKGLGLLEKYARAAGCHGMELWGRRGWERYLRPHGFESALYVVRKDL